MAQLPTLADLHKDPQEAFKNDELKLLLNQPPHQSWIKIHPMAKNQYLPIDKVEALLDYIFQLWRVEILSVQAMLNSICVAVRLHYLNPVSGEWSFMDGVGAKSIQTDKGATAADLAAIKDAAIQMAAPAAESYAVKDAAQKLGKIFGRDLSRKDTVTLPGAYLNPQPAPQVQYQQAPAQAAPTAAVPATDRPGLPASSSTAGATSCSASPTSRPGPRPTGSPRTAIFHL